MSKKNSLAESLRPDTRITPPQRVSWLAVTSISMLSGALISGAMLYVFGPQFIPATVSPAPLSDPRPTDIAATIAAEIAKSPALDAVSRAQNSMVYFYRNSKNNLLSPDDRIGIGVAVTSDGWVAVGEEAFAQTPGDVVAVARGTESIVEKKITDPFSHVTFVKIKREDLQVVPFANSTLGTGSSVTEFSRSGNVSFGFLTNPRRHLATTPMASETLDVSVETTTDRASGAILFSADGALLGIAGKKDFTTAGSVIQEATKLLLKKGTFTRPKLAITALDLSSVVVRKKQLPTDGALVAKKGTAPAVPKKSAVEVAGLKEGDVIVKFDTIDINADHTLAEALSLYSTGTSIPLTLWRNGTTVQITISL